MPRFPETDRVTSKLPFFNGGMIASFTHCPALVSVSSVTTATNWPTANLGIYVPVIVPEAVTVKQLGWFNGTVLGSSADAGIYTLDGTRIISTTPTAQSGTSAWQLVDITDTAIGPGTFYLAVSLNGTNRLGYLALTTASFAEAFGLAQEASVATLPANATMATTAQALLPLIAAMVDLRS